MQEYTVKEWPSGRQEWFQHGKLHRDDGPAVIWADGTQEYWLKGQPHTYEEWKRKTDPDSCDGRVVEIEGKKYKLQEI